MATPDQVPLAEHRFVLEKLQDRIRQVEQHMREALTKAEYSATILARSRYDLRQALMRMLWKSVADQASCTCDLSSVCPECEALRALGFEPGWTSPAMVAAYLEQERSSA